MAGGVLSTTSSRSKGLLCPRSRGVVFALAFSNVLKEKGLLSIKLALDVIGGFVKGTGNVAEPLESATVAANDGLGVLRPLWLSPGCGIPVVAHWVSWHLSCCLRAPS